METAVSFFGYFRDIVNEGRAQLILPNGASLADLIQALAQRYGDRVRERLLRGDGSLQSGVRIVVGGEVVDSLDHRFGEGAQEVDVFVMHEVAGGAEVKEDVWIDTTCALCYSCCAIRAHRVNGVVVKIEGNPDCPATNGRICPKGLSGTMLLYDPNRVNTPLKRTNPEKGRGIDPKWVPISWEEALDIVTEKLRKVRQEDPRKLLAIGSVTNLSLYRQLLAFAIAFGTPNTWNSGAGTHCGAGEHIMAAMVHHAWAWNPDADHCQYFLNFGTPAGFGAHYANVAMTQRMAEARVKGMKHVVIDPWMGMAAEKADEWVPIRPGTDTALVLGMINLLINEYGLYDAESLKHHTNAPYLIGPDGFYLRDESGKVQVWDAGEGRAKPYDDPTIQDFALEGSYTVRDTICRPAFMLLKEQVERYTPEWVSAITTIPPHTISRLAREFGEAARIGSTITLEGKTLPYRPVVVGYFKGSQGHRHATLAAMATELLREVVGASAVPGATLGTHARSLGHPETAKPQWGPKVGPDGLMVLDTFAWPVASYNPYPPRPARKPETVTLIECVPLPGSTSFPPLVMAEPEKYGLSYKIEVVLNACSNFPMTTADPELVTRAFKDLFIINYGLFPDESSELADLLLPDACYLERLDIDTDWMCSGPPTGVWSYHLRQPVVQPLHQRRQFEPVTLELAERLDMRRDLNMVLNMLHHLDGEYALDPERRYTWEEIVDRRYKAWFGSKFGVNWFKENGVLTWPKKVEEVYWRPFMPVRVPIYFEFFPRIGQEVEKIKQETGIPFDTGDFQPLPDWKPCRSHEDGHPEFDLYGIYFRTPFHAFTYTNNNPLLDEISKIDPYNFCININAQTAARKGIQEGDWVMVESGATGQRVRGQAKLVQGLHPEVIAVAGSGGHWSQGLPVATQEGKGVNFEWLLPLTFEDTDTLSFNQDLCVKVKVYKEATQP
jgi:molybdopterin-containing oxidoreductase family molybdopterin binding subunit